MQVKVTISERGTITLPETLCRAAGFKANDELLVEETEQGLLLRLSPDSQIEIYSEERIAEFARDEDAIGRLLSDGR